MDTPNAGVLPPVPLPRRMWAGGRLTSGKPTTRCRLGRWCGGIRASSACSTSKGVCGELVFCWYNTRFTTNAAWPSPKNTTSCTARHPGPARPATTPGGGHRGAMAAPWLADGVMLFRFSALTFNGHRIHYDRSYVTQTEGYPGLVVHGPLIATLLVDLWRHQHPRGHTDALCFQGTTPNLDIHRFAVCANHGPGANRLVGARPRGLADHAGPSAVDMSPRPLDGITVVSLDRSGRAVCTRQLADMGARVIRLSAPAW